MSVVEFYDNFDSMVQRLNEQIERANDRTTPTQKKIGYGDYWMQPYEDFIIFGYIYTREELDEDERRLGATDDEIEEEHTYMDDSYARGFRFGRAYSVIEPEGELGDTHISVMWPITKEQFEEAKSLNWDTEKIFKLSWCRTKFLQQP